MACIALDRAGSVSAAIASYYSSPTFRNDLRSSSQEMRRATLEAFRRQYGEKLLGTMPKKFLQALLDSMSPAAARNWLGAIRALMRHCIRLELLRDDPTLGIKLRPMRSDGHHTWSEDEIAQFEAHYPIGSKPRLALALGLYTGQRRGDVVKMGRQHIRNGMMHVRQQKTGTPLAIPIHPNLQAVLDATALDGMTFLTANNGRPFVAKSFSDWFRKQCGRAGLPPECSFHGLRKAACRRLAEAGCSASEIAAISGHKTLREISRYTAGADQERLARNAMARNIEATSSVKIDQPQVSKALK